MSYLRLRQSAGTPTQSRIRGIALQAIIARVLRANPLCVICHAKGLISRATEVDHIVALCNGGSDTDNNRQGLCWKCHQDKTREDLGYKAKPGCGVDGVPPGWK